MTTVIGSAPFVLAHQPSRTELLAKYFRGLGDPTRLCILRLLDEAGELPVGEIVSRRELCVIDPDGHGHMVAELQPDSVGRDPAST